MFGLIIFGTLLEKAIGPKNFLFVYFASAIFVGATGIFFYSAVIGASGAIFGIMATLAVLRPWLIVYVGVPLPMVALVIFYAIINSALAASYSTDPVAYMGHLAGIVIGIVLGIYFYPQFKEKKVKRKKIKLDAKKHREWENRWLRNPVLPYSSYNFSSVNSRIAWTNN